MPSFTWTQSIAAGATFDPLDSAGWMYRYVPYNAVVEVIDNATALGVVVSRTFGSDTIQQESPVSAGGTAAVIPSRLNVEPITEKSNATDLLRVVYRNTTAGAITVNGIIQLTRVQ
jgi:uncharacterized protein CbrC (UPF0167 family)